jgi:hypothetical protein
MTAFRSVWSYLSDHLRSGKKIEDKSTLSASRGESTTIVSIDADSITVAPPRAKGFVRIPKADFELVWRYWSDFQSKKITRTELREHSRFSRYILTLFQWYEDHGK